MSSAFIIATSFMNIDSPVSLKIFAVDVEESHQIADKYKLSNIPKTTPYTSWGISKATDGEELKSTDISLVINEILPKPE